MLPRPIVIWPSPRIPTAAHWPNCAPRSARAVPATPSGGRASAAWRGSSERFVPPASRTSPATGLGPRVPCHPMYWIPTESPGAAAYVRARARLRGGRVRRLLAAARQHADDLLHGRIGSPISAIARRPPLPSARHDPVAWLSDQWSSWGLGRLPQRVSTLLVTGGPRSVSKVVLLAFAEPGAVPVVAIKAPRVKEAVGGIRREGAALSSLAARYPGGVSGVPRMLDQRETDGVPLLSETALVGRPLEAVLTPDNLGSWSTKIADWLAALVGDQTARPPDHWCEAIVEPALSRFEALFGTVVDRGLLRECADIARGIGPFPSAPEQRDFGPWNVLVTTVGDIAVLDWESAEMDGLPVLDLLYYLAYASFSADGARDRGSRITSYRRSLDPTTSTGAIRRECLARYVQATGLESAPARSAPSPRVADPCAVGRATRCGRRRRDAIGRGAVAKPVPGTVEGGNAEHRRQLTAGSIRGRRAPRVGR